MPNEETAVCQSYSEQHPGRHRNDHGARNGDAEPGDAERHAPPPVEPVGEQGVGGNRPGQGHGPAQDKAIGQIQVPHVPGLPHGQEPQKQHGRTDEHQHPDRALRDQPADPGPRQGRHRRLYREGQRNLEPVRVQRHGKRFQQRAEGVEQGSHGQELGEEGEPHDVPAEEIRRLPGPRGWRRRGAVGYLGQAPYYTGRPTPACQGSLPLLLLPALRLEGALHQRSPGHDAQTPGIEFECRKSR